MRIKTVLNLSVAAFAVAGALAFVSVGCGPKSDSETGTKTGSDAPKTGDKKAPVTGKLSVDGSSTVFPIVNLLAEDFNQKNPGAVTANKSGTGSGFQKFTRGEIQIATASRPIEAKEIDALAAAKIDFIEIPIAYDGVSVIVSPDNKFADKLTVEELTKAWAPTSTVKTWADIRAGLPADKINFYGPSDNHGTYEYFTEAICKVKKKIRKDYQANQEYTAIVGSVAGDKNGIAYVGYNYYAENKTKVKAVAVDAGKGGVLPDEKTISDGSYTPLSRPLFLYVSKQAYDSNPAVKSFVEYALSAEGMKAVTEAKYVQLPKEALDAVKKHVAEGKAGSLFKDVKPGMTITQVLSKETGK